MGWKGQVLGPEGLKVVSDIVGSYFLPVLLLHGYWSTTHGYCFYLFVGLHTKVRRGGINK